MTKQTDVEIMRYMLLARLCLWVYMRASVRPCVRVYV